MKKYVLIVLCLLLVTGCSIKRNSEFVFENNGKKYILGEEFLKENYGEPLQYSEVASCAFEGLDKTYTYESFEVTTYPVDGVDKLYVIYFLNDEIKTTEGIKIGDSYASMVSTYGEEFETQGNLYTYTKGKTQLKFMVENDIITSIEYDYEI